MSKIEQFVLENWADIERLRDEVQRVVAGVQAQLGDVESLLEQRKWWRPDLSLERKRDTGELMITGEKWKKKIYFGLYGFTAECLFDRKPANQPCAMVWNGMRPRPRFNRLVRRYAARAWKPTSLRLPDHGDENTWHPLQAALVSLSPRYNSAYWLDRYRRGRLPAAVAAVFDRLAYLIKPIDRAFAAAKGGGA